MKTYYFIKHESLRKPLYISANSCFPYGTKTYLVFFPGFCSDYEKNINLGRCN